MRFNVSPYTSITVGAKRPFSFNDMVYGIYVCSGYAGGCKVRTAKLSTSFVLTVSPFCITTLGFFSEYQFDLVMSALWLILGIAKSLTIDVLRLMHAVIILSPAPNCVNRPTCTGDMRDSSVHDEESVRVLLHRPPPSRQCQNIESPFFHWTTTLNSHRSSA